MSNKIILSLIAFLFSLPAFAQHRWKTELQQPAQSGFYKIQIDPVLGARLNADLSDLRISDGKNQVPYLRNVSVLPTGSVFRTLPIVRSSTDTSGTVIVLDSRAYKGLENISLIMANTAVERQASLSGSQDGKQWFIIHENLHLSNAGTNEEGKFIQSLQFPFTQYAYFKLLIKNRGTDPLNVLSAGVWVYDHVEVTQPTVVHEGTRFMWKDTAGMTRVVVMNNEPYAVDRINLAIDAPKFYKREVSIYRSDAGGKKGDWLGAATLTSESETYIPLPGVKSENFLLEIYNGDNPPLTIKKVTTAAAPREVIAWLEKGKGYILLAGDSLAKAPEYDLKQFRDSIPAKAPLLAYGPLQPHTIVMDEAGRSDWLWPTIIAMLLVLGVLTFRLVGEVKRREG